VTFSGYHRIKYVFAKEQGHLGKKGRLFSFGFLGFTVDAQCIGGFFLLLIHLAEFNHRIWP
jgi:hypothetical protein